MSETADRYGVRIRPPDGLTPDGIGELALMIAPITGQSATDLETELARGAVVVAQSLALAEARQLVAVFGSLGANAELVEPDTEPGGRQLFSEDEVVDDAWRTIKTEGGSEPPSTLPFDVANMRAALTNKPAIDTIDEEQVPGIKQTQPFDASLIKSVVEGAEAAATQPLEMGDLGAHIEPLPGAEHYAATQRIDAETLRKAVDEAEASVVQTQPFDGSVLREALAATAGTAEMPDVPTAPFEREALIGPPPKVVEEISTVKWGAGNQSTDPFDPGTEPPVEARPTERLDIEPVTHPRSITQAQTRPRALDALVSTREMAGGAHGLARGEGSPSNTTTQATTAKFSRKIADPLHATSDMGSVSAGPLIFKLEAPPPQPTETGSVPRAVRLGDVTGEVPRVPAESRSEHRPSGALPVFDLNAELSTPRPDVYRLGGTGPSSRVVSISPPPTGQMPAFTPGAGSPASPEAGSGSFQVVGSGGVQSYLAPGQRAQAVEPQPAVGVHSATTAGFLSLVLPGMGQVYNGERERAVWFAIGAVLIVPWLWGVVDAISVAQAINRGARRPPENTARAGAMRSHLTLNLAIVFGIVLGVFLWQRMAAHTAALPPEPAPAPLAVIVDAAVPDAARDTGPTREEIRAKVDALMKRGRQACGRGRYAECEEIMHAILKIDVTYRAAHSLLVEAVSKRRRREKNRGKAPVADPP